MTSKGYGTRAVRDLIDMLGDSDEKLTFFCLHDADNYGTLIYQSLQQATKARPGRRVEIVDLGLDAKEALAMGLPPEPVDPLEKGKRRPVADGVPKKCEEWYQRYRIELNAMSTPDFIEWLDNKIEKYAPGKLIPPDQILAEELHSKAKDRIRERTIDQILRDQDAEGQIERSYEKLKPTLDAETPWLRNEVKDKLEQDQAKSWRQPVADKAAIAVESSL